jgi:hypothetical protein
MASLSLCVKGDLLMHRILKILSVACAAIVLPLAASAQPATTPSVQSAADTPIQHTIFVDMKNGADVLALDRWYLTYHAPETLARTNRAQTKYVSYRTYNVTDSEATLFNMVRGRVTEIGFQSVAAFRVGVTPEVLARNPATLPDPTLRNGFTSETLTLRTAPQTIFKDTMPAPKGTPFARWLVFVSFPSTVSPPDGDKWLNDVLGPALAQEAGVRKAILYRTAIPRSYSHLLEVWFDDPTAWRLVLANLSANASLKPSWATSFPYMNVRSALVGERPDLDFMSDKRVIP